jgi:hypothetical protein
VEAKREREITELREKERSKAAEHRQKKQAGVLPDTPALSKLTEEAIRARYQNPETLAKGGTLLRYGGILLAIFGLVVLFDEVGYVMRGYRFDWYFTIIVDPHLFRIPCDKFCPCSDLIARTRMALIS